VSSSLQEFSFVDDGGNGNNANNDKTNKAFFPNHLDSAELFIFLHVAILITMSSVRFNNYRRFIHIHLDLILVLVFLLTTIFSNFPN